MKLLKKHIGQLFDVAGGDGSWVYQLVAVNKTHLLFYAFGGKYWKEKKGRTDWRRFRPMKSWRLNWVERGWRDCGEIK